jgi:hypothetical protein
MKTVDGKIMRQRTLNKEGFSCACNPQATLLTGQILPLIFFGRERRVFTEVPAHEGDSKYSINSSIVTGGNLDDT